MDASDFGQAELQATMGHLVQWRQGTGWRPHPRALVAGRDDSVKGEKCANEARPRARLSRYSHRAVGEPWEAEGNQAG